LDSFNAPRGAWGRACNGLTTDTPRRNPMAAMESVPSDKSLWRIPGVQYSTPLPRWHEGEPVTTARETEFARICQVFRAPTESHELERELEHRLPHLRAGTDRELLAHVLMCLGTRHLFGGNVARAEPYIAEGLAVVDPIAHCTVYLGLLNLRGVAHEFGREVVGACEVYAAMIRAAREHAVHHYILIGHENLAYTFLELGDFTGALELVDSVEPLSRQLSDMWRSRWLVVRHAVLTQAHRYPDAEAHVPELTALFADPTVGDNRCRSLFRLHQAEILLSRPQPTERLRQLEAELAEMQAHPSCGIPETRARIRWLRSRTHLARGDAHSAIVHASAGIAVVHGGPLHTLCSMLFEARAHAHRALDDHNAAWSDLSRSAEIARKVMHGSVGRALRSTVDRLHDELAHLREVELVNINRSLREANDALQRAREEADRARSASEAAAETRTRFLSSMSHELRTPLNGVIGTADLLGTTPLSDHQQALVRVLSQSALLTLKIVDDILELGRLERGDLLLQLGPFDLHALLHATADLLAPSARDRGLALHLHIDTLVPTTVVGDARRLQQMLLNLVGNALKYTRVGQVSVQVTRQRRGQVRFEVTDTGPGIPADEQRRIFDIYERTRATHASNPDGTGLGLTICRELTTALGGTIGVDSVIGEGSTFWFTLPLPACSAPPPAPATAQPARSLSGHRILLAEDNQVNQLVIAQTVRSLGARVDVVEDGVAALEALAAHAYTAGLIDLHMPRLGGLDVARRARKQGLTTPLVALTASALPHDRDAALAAGMDAFATKPIGRPELARVVWSAIRATART